MAGIIKVSVGVHQGLYLASFKSVGLLFLGLGVESAWFKSLWSQDCHLYHWCLIASAHVVQNLDLQISKAHSPDPQTLHVGKR